MNVHMRAVAETCNAAAKNDSMTFPQIVGALMNAGFESYLVDLRRGTKTYYLSTGDAVELSGERCADMAAAFDPPAVNAAVREAQQQAPGYTYKRFCAKVARAGCAGYVVSFLGRRVVYFGRTAETHVEHFPSR